MERWRQGNAMKRPRTELSSKSRRRVPFGPPYTLGNPIPQMEKTRPCFTFLQGKTGNKEPFNEHAAANAGSTKDGIMRNRDRLVAITLPLVILIAFVLAACGGGSGAGQFDNARAAKAVMDRIKSEQIPFLKSSGKAIEFSQSERATTPPQFQAFCKGSKEQQEGLAKLQEKGLLKIYDDAQSGCTYVSFSDKAAPDTQKQEKATIVLLARVDKVEVTDLGTGKQTRTVKYKVSYVPTAFGETLLKPEQLTEEKEAGFSLSFDEGWRMN